VATVGAVTVARFTREIVLAGQLAEAVGDRLAALLAGRLVVDFANVRSLSSLMLAKLVTLNRAAAGRLALCNLRPDVREIMEVTRLTVILRIYAGEQDALASVGAAGRGEADTARAAQKGRSEGV
jgi:anti-sigma B factor antagonist